MILSTAIVAIFYAFVGIVAACVLPLDKVAGVNISVVAKEVFPAPIYLFFVIGGAWFALLTTLNGSPDLDYPFSSESCHGWMASRNLRKGK